MRTNGYLFSSCDVYVPGAPHFSALCRLSVYCPVTTRRVVRFQADRSTTTRRVYISTCRSSLSCDVLSLSHLQIEPLLCIFWRPGRSIVVHYSSWHDDCDVLSLSTTYYTALRPATSTPQRPFQAVTLHLAHCYCSKFTPTTSAGVVFKDRKYIVLSGMYVRLKILFRLVELLAVPYTEYY